jgi:CO/xanthine dehydrogenase FAD-binding subunit
MVIAHDFEYLRPETVADAVAALAVPGARVLAGGTDVVPWLRDDAIEPARLVDIKAIPDLDAITLRSDRITLGALVTFSDVVGSAAVGEAVPMLQEMAHWVASIGIRNRATVIGNLCSAVPSLDAGPALLVYDAELHIATRGGGRRVPLRDWFVGPKQTCLHAGELVTGVTLRIPPAHGAAFLKLARYAGEDLAQASLAVVVTGGGEVRVAFGAVAPVPFRADAIEALLRGRSLDEDRIAGAQALVPGIISPISDVRASAEYRTHMCRIMLARGLQAAASRLAGGGPPYPAHLL